jgi:hypothetical protein
MRLRIVAPAALAFALTLTLAALPLSRAEAEPYATGGVTPYIWIAGAKGEVHGKPGSPSVDVAASFDNLTDHLESGLMLEGDLRVGRVGGFVDLDIVKFSNARDVEVNQFVSAASDVDLRVVGGTVALFYHFGDSDLLAVDAVAGARITSTRMEARLQINNLPVGAKHNQQWWDPIIGVRTTVQLTDRIGLVAYGDYGGFGVNSDAVWQVYGAASFAFNNTFSISAGYRYYVVDFHKDELDYNVTTAGPLIGARFQF